MAKKNTLHKLRRAIPSVATQLQHKEGEAPGTVRHVGAIKVRDAHITLLDYDAKNLEEITFPSLTASRTYQRQHQFYWLNVYGLHDERIMQEIGNRFGLHPLVLEDIVNTRQRPKIDDYGDYLFIALKGFIYDAEHQDCQAEQISLVLGKDFVLSFQERPSGLFNPVRERLRTLSSPLRQGGPDSLLHALIDTLVDRYFVVTEALAEDIEALEEKLISKAPRHAMQEIKHLKHEMLELRHSVWPTREVLNTLLRTNTQLLAADTQPYFRDVYDHAIHLIEQLDSLRELLGDLLNIHMANVSNQQNAELRILTIVTTLFAPATVITGFFGMNFRTMPLLEQREGWEIALGGILIGGLMLWLVLLWRNYRIRRGFH